MQNHQESDTLTLIEKLDLKLIELLKSLTPEEWESQTIAKLWKVKDVAAHLLDGNLRGLSTSRDHYFGEKPSNIDSYQDLVAYLNGLNLSWTISTKRLSPNLILSLLENSGKEYLTHLKTLEPNKNATFSVAWAGQDQSPNWFHIAREYTEKFLHQQQIREAVNQPGIMTKELFYPFIDTLMYAFPHNFKHIDSTIGTIVSIKINSDIGGTWNIVKSEYSWVLDKNNYQSVDVQVKIDPEIAWKLFSKSWKPEEVIDQVEILGNQKLGIQVLNMVSVMA